jgi:hypothetical protein
MPSALRIDDIRFAPARVDLCTMRLERIAQSGDGSRSTEQRRFPLVPRLAAVTP